MALIDLNMAFIGVEMALTGVKMALIEVKMAFKWDYSTPNWGSSALQCAIPPTM